MINVSSLAYAVFTSVASNAALVNSGYSAVEFGTAVNQNMDRAPWIGVWPGDLTMVPKNIVGGIPLTWRGTAEVLIYHQCANRVGQAVAELKEAQNMILTAVASDVPMKGQSLFLAGFTGALERFTPEEDESFLTNLLRFTYSVEAR